MELQRQNSVQEKIACLFEIQVDDHRSNKRQYQPFSVYASDQLCPEVELHNIAEARSTEKLDGTCCYIAEFNGKPWLWARHDRKPNKVGDRKLKKYFREKEQWRANGRSGDKPTMNWEVAKDFKDVPDNWIPALAVRQVDGVAQPNERGHIPGWVPVDVKGRQHLWHLAAVDLDQGQGLVLRQLSENGLSLDCIPLASLCDQTVELIGTNVNANPYNLGTKQQPVHCLVIHGSINTTSPSPLTLPSLVDWLEHDENGRVEGIVWHCPTGALFKLHRHHVHLKWPIANPRLSQASVTINVHGSKFDSKSQFCLLSKKTGFTCEKLCEIHKVMYDDTLHECGK